MGCVKMEEDLILAIKHHRGCDIVKSIHSRVTPSQWYLLLIKVNIMNRIVPHCVSSWYHRDRGCVEQIKSIMNFIHHSLTSDQWWHMLISKENGTTVLHLAIKLHLGHAENQGYSQLDYRNVKLVPNFLSFIHKSVTADQWYKMLTTMDEDGNTVIHLAMKIYQYFHNHDSAIKNRQKHFRFRLLPMKNKDGQTVSCAYVAIADRSALLSSDHKS